MNKKEMKTSVPCSMEEYYYKLDNMLLSSSQHVRHTFKLRFKAETRENWVDEKVKIHTFFKDLGRKAYKLLSPFQKKSVNESNSVDDWDMSLLCIVIQNFGEQTKYENENLAVRQLKDLRNELAHNSHKKFTKIQYDELVKKITATLACLGLGESDIDRLIERAGVTSSLKAYERVNILFGQANKFMKRDNFKQAIDRYSEAIATPSLLPINLGETYEKRANCYLKSVKSEIIDGDHCDQALLDIQQALELNSSSWNANYLAAQCYRRKNNLSEALRYYEIALALSPAQKQVKRDLDTCKVLAGVYARKDNLNPHMLPMNLNERLAKFNSEMGMKISKQQFIRANRDLAGQFIKGQDHVFRGHQHYHGWVVEQSFTEAVKYYTKADVVGNPEGSYNLAMCFHYGRGVQDDIDKAFKMYKRVAEMDGNIRGNFTSLNCNVGVAAAQHAVALCYDNGTGVEQDHREAAMWYQRAMENGVGNAANNLGLLYSKGLGVKLNEKMAEMCWKQGVNLKDVNAADSLVGYYINQMEPELAEEWIKVGREIGNDKLRGTSDEDFNKILALVRSNRVSVKPMVIEFEKRHNLETKGHTFLARLNRAQKHDDPNMAQIYNVWRNAAIAESISPTYVENWGGRRQEFTDEKIQALFQKALQGSIAAQRIIRTISISIDLNELLASDIDESRSFQMNILDMLYECATLEFHFVCLHPEAEQKMKTIVAEFFESSFETIGMDDMKIRYCYIRLNLRSKLFKSDDTYALEIIKEGVRRYLDNPYYHDILLCCMGGRHLWKDGVLVAKEAIAKFPDNVEILYHHAVFSRRCQNVNYLEVVSAYEKFLLAAPREHRKVPEAFYHIAFIHSFQELENKSTDLLDKAKEYVKRGEEAERDQLPCYLPYGESDVKRLLMGFMGKLNEIENGSMDGKRPNTSLIQPKSVLERKTYLLSPVRKAHILQHRQNLNKFKKFPLTFNQTVRPKLCQTVAKKLSTLKPITLLEMNPTEDKIFENRLLELTLIDEPNHIFSSIHLIAEDDNGDTTRLYIYKVKRDTETLERFQAGCRIAIINPYMRIGAQTLSNGIRNDESKCIVDLEKVKKMCRFCGERNSILICTNCKRPYCCPECLKLDFELFDHKLICSTEK